MTNMKDRLRPNRETKVKLLSKTKSINAKAKEKFVGKKDLTSRRVLSKKNVKENLMSLAPKTLKNVKEKPSTRQKTKEPKHIKGNSSILLPVHRRKPIPLNGKASKENIAQNVAVKKARKTKVLTALNGQKSKPARAVKKNVVECNNNENNKKKNQSAETKEKPKRPYNRKKSVSITQKKGEVQLKHNDQIMEIKKNLIWDQEFIIPEAPVFVDYQQPKKSDIRKLSDKPRRHKCNICEKAFLGKNDLRKHSLIHYGILPFLCSHCPRRFRQAGNLRNHIVTNHPETLEQPPAFICDYCERSFSIKERLRLHIRVHTGFKPYECPECHMSFARIGQLKQHRITHSGAKNYQCDICDGLFTCKAKLKLHINSHYDIRNYTCYVCGKRFARPDAFNKHLSCFHNDEKPFECTICHKKLKGHLTEHMRTHNDDKPHGCDVCGSRFVQRSQLVVHQRIHSGTRPYRCRVCWKAFAHSTALTLHTRHHTGEKPFPCRFCETPFSQLSHLKKHMQVLHGDGRAYYHNACKEAFRTKSLLDKHLLTCTYKLDSPQETPEERLSRKIAESFQPSEPLMAVTKMRLLLAVLLKKICSKQKLQRLGFNKRLIDDILLEALESSGRAPCVDPSFTVAQRLKVNVQKFLDWTVPPMFMNRFKDENKSTEELLEELTS